MFNKFTTQLALRKAGLGDLKIPDPFAAPKGGSSNKNDSADTGFANPFANVKWGAPKAFASWQSPPPPRNPIQPAPTPGERARTATKLRFPPVDGRPVVVLFMRYCGCPFTEKLFKQLRSLANRHTAVHFIAVSHCTKAATDAWVRAIGGAWNLDVVVDEARDLYALWGLGMSSYAHLLNPRNGFNQIMLGRNEGVWGQQVGEGGCRWQTGGMYAVDDMGVVRWGRPMNSVDEQIDFEDGVEALGLPVRR